MKKSRFFVLNTNINWLPILCFILSCDLNVPDENDIATWSTKIEIPLLEKSITFEDILEDSLINPIEGSDLYAFTKEIQIDTVTVGDKLEIDDIHKGFSQSVDDVNVEDSNVEEKIGFDAVGISPIDEIITSEIGTISLNDIPESLTDPYTFLSIYPALASVDDGIESIPEFTMHPVTNPFSFSDFTQAVFTNGMLILTITNDLPIPLGETIIKLQKEDGTEIFGGTIIIPGDINPGESGTGSLLLSDEFELPGNIQVQVTGSSPGGDNVEINSTTKNSSFRIKISANSLEVVSATAKIPEQSILKNDMIELSSADSNKVESATILNGNLIITINNNMEVGSTVTMNIPTIRTPGGESFQSIMNIPADEPYEFPLNGHILTMPIDNQRVAYNFEVLTLDSENEFIEINSTDNVEISLSLTGESPGDDLTFSDFTGRVSPQNLGFDGTIKIESESEITEAVLDGGILEINVQNHVNETSSGSPTAVITIPELKSSDGNSFSITLDHLFNVVEKSIDLSNFTLLPNDQQELTYSAEVTTLYDEIGSYKLTDSIFVNIIVKSLSFREVTGLFNQEAMVDSNTISIEDSTIIESAVIKSGELNLNIDNHIGVMADIQFTINEFFKNEMVLDTIFALSPEGASFVIDLSGYTLILNGGHDSQTVSYVSTISLPNDEEMTLSLQDSIAVDVTLANLKFESVTGNIKPVKVTIEPVVQKIDGFPDGIEEFEFTSVDMFIDFDTDVGISMILNLDIEASNAEGEHVISSVSDWDITMDNRVIIPNAEALINIFPDTIRASGEATVFGDGTVTTSQVVTGKMTVQAPLSFHVPPDTEMDIDITETDIELDGKTLENVVIYFDINNQFDFGTSLSVYATNDSNLFNSSDEDTLFSNTILPNHTWTDSVVLNTDKISLFTGEKLYIKPEVAVSGSMDNNGNPIPSSVLSTDSLNILLYGQLELLIDLMSDGNNE